MKNFHKLFYLVLLIAIISSASLAYADGEIVGKYKWRYGNVGCAFDTTNNVFFVYHEAEHTVYKLDGTNYTPLDTIPVPFTISHSDYAWSMAFDGTTLWLACPWSANYPGLYGMDPQTGDSVGFIDPGVGGLLRGVDWDGKNFWIGTNDGGTGMIYKISPTGEQLKSFGLDQVSWLNQICLAEEQIWINDDRLNFTCYDTTGTFVEKTPSQIPGAWGFLSHDLTFDGNDVVNVCWGQDIIYKMYIGKGHGKYLLAPTDISVYSDQAMPNSIRLNWTNPTQYLNGNAGTVSKTNIYNGETSELIGTSTNEEFVAGGLVNGESYTFYVQSVNDEDIEGVSSEKVGARAGGPKSGDLVSKIPLYSDGWTSSAFDGKYAWVYNENGAFFAKFDVQTGDTIKTIPFAQWTNGAVWDESDSTIILNSYDTGTGEIWKIDTLGNLLSWFPTDIEPAKSQRGLAWDGTNYWVGQTDKSTFYLFDKTGQDQGVVYADSSIGWQRGMTWVKDQLWVLDGGSKKLRIFDFNGVDSLHQIAEIGYWWDGWPLDLFYTGENVYVTGWLSSDFYLLFTDELNAIDDQQGHTVQGFALEQNYPNPFNPQTTISYTLSTADKVTLDIYDLLGQKVITLVDKHQKAGKHTVQWMGKNQFGRQVSSGVYFYKLISGKYSSIKKMMLLR